MSTIYNLFISHAWKYSDDYVRFENLLNAAPRFTWRNYSVPRADPVIAKNGTALARKLDDQMKPAQVVVILGGIYVSHSDWIQYEIHRATQWGKPVLGVRPWGSTNLPLAVSKAADEIVGWNTSTIVDAIRRLA